MTQDVFNDKPRSYAIKIIDKKAKGFEIPALQKEIQIMKKVPTMFLSC